MTDDVEGLVERLRQLWVDWKNGVGCGATMPAILDAAEALTKLAQERERFDLALSARRC